MTDKAQKQAASDVEALAEAQQEAMEAPKDAVPGGRYLDSDGKTFVDANGVPIKGSK